MKSFLKLSSILLLLCSVMLSCVNHHEDVKVTNQVEKNLNIVEPPFSAFVLGPAFALDNEIVNLQAIVTTNGVEPYRYEWLRSPNSNENAYTKVSKSPQLSFNQYLQQYSYIKLYVIDDTNDTAFAAHIVKNHTL